MEENFPPQKATVKTGLIGQVLLKKGIINNEQLEEALKIQKQKKLLIGEILLELGYVSAESLAVSLAGQSDLAYVPVEKYKVPQELVRWFPSELAHKHACIPLAKMGSVLTVAMVNPLDRVAVEEIEKATVCKLICMFGAQDQLELGLKKYYKQ